MDGGGHGGGGHGGGGHGGSHGGHSGHGGGLDGGFAGGRGNEAPPAARLIQCDEYAVIAIKPWGLNRLLGLSFLGFGFVALCGSVMCLFALLQNSDAEAAIGPFVGALVFLAFGFMFSYTGYSLLEPKTLRLDALTRTYVERRGWRPWCKEIHGSWEDIAQISLHAYSSRGKGTTLFLDWRDPKRTRFALHTSEAEEAQRYRQVIARLVGLSYFGEDGQLVVSNGSVPPVRPETLETPAGKEGVAGTTAPPYRARRALAGRFALPVLLGITLLNSYGGGLTLMRSWRDGDGGRWIFSSSLWKNDTLYIDAQGQMSETQGAYTPFSASTRTTGSLPERRRDESDAHWRLTLCRNADTALDRARKGAAIFLAGYKPRAQKVRRRLSESVLLEDAPAALLLNLRVGSKRETRRFQFYYKYNDVSQGQRYWSQLSPLQWQEKYDNGQTTQFRVLERTRVDGDSGITAKKQDGTGLVVFIPDKGSHRMKLLMKSNGSQRWEELGEMTHIE